MVGEGVLDRCVVKVRLECCLIILLKELIYFLENFKFRDFFCMLIYEVNKCFLSYFFLCLSREDQKLLCNLDMLPCLTKSLVLGRSARGSDVAPGWAMAMSLNCQHL